MSSVDNTDKKLIDDNSSSNWPIRLYPNDPTPSGPYKDDDWFRFYGPNPGYVSGTTHYEVHELDCSLYKCVYRNEPCPWHKKGCKCSMGACQMTDNEFDEILENQ